MQLIFLRSGSFTMSRLSRWAKIEKEKIAGIPGAKDKAAYIWEYYKIPIVAIVFFIWFAGFAIHQYTTTLHEYWYYMIFNNTYADAGDGSDIWEDYVEYAGFDLTEKAVEFNAQSYFDYKKGATGNSYFEAFVAYADSGTLDGITMETESLSALGKTGRLLDLNSAACASIKEKYGDRFVYSIPYDDEYSTEEVPVGIDVSDSKLIGKYNVYSGDCAFAIGANSSNIEAAEMFLDFILQSQTGD